MISFDLIVDKVDDYELFLKKTESHFDLDFYKLSSEYADAFNNEKKYIVTASPSKISFLIPGNIEELLYEVKTYLVNNFSDQIVGIRCIGEEEKLSEILSIPKVKTLVLR